MVLLETRLEEFSQNLVCRKFLYFFYQYVTHVPWTHVFSLHHVLKMRGSSV